MEEQKLNFSITPEVASGEYVNLAVVTHSSSEFVLDFLSMLPGYKDPNVRSRVIMTPENAKKLLMALQNNVNKYEQQFGRININTPSSSVPMSFGGGEA